MSKDFKSCILIQTAMRVGRRTIKTPPDPRILSQLLLNRKAETRREAKSEIKKNLSHSHSKRSAFHTFKDGFLATPGPGDPGILRLPCLGAGRAAGLLLRGGFCGRMRLHRLHQGGRGGRGNTRRKQVSADLPGNVFKRPIKGGRCR